MIPFRFSSFSLEIFLEEGRRDGKGNEWVVEVGDVGVEVSKLP